MNEKNIIDICDSHNSETEITKAKQLLFDTAKTTKRNVLRKQEGKTRRALQDIITVFKETDPSDVPIFVARDLCRLPPVNFDHIDVTRLLKDIVALQQEITLIKSNYTPMETTKDIQRQLNMSLGKKGNDTSLFTSPCASVQLPPPEPTVLEQNTPHRGFRTDTLEFHSPSADISGPMGFIQTDTTSGNNHTTDKNTTFAAIANIPKPIKTDTAQQIDADGFITVTRRKIKQKPKRNIHGTSKIVSKLKVATPMINIYLSGFDKSVTTADISDYIKETGESCEKIELLPEREGIPNNAFNLTVAKDKFSKFVNSELWPPGITVGKYKPYAYNAYKRTPPTQITPAQNGQ